MAIDLETLPGQGGNIDPLIDDFNSVNAKTKKFHYFLVLVFAVCVIVLFFGLYFPIQYGAVEMINVIGDSGYINDNKMYISPFPETVNTTLYGVENIARTCLYPPIKEYLEDRVINCTASISPGIFDSYYCPLGYACVASDDVPSPFVVCVSVEKQNCKISDCGYTINTHKMKHTDDPFVKYINFDYPESGFYQVVVSVVLVGLGSVVGIVGIALIYLKHKSNLSYSYKVPIVILGISVVLYSASSVVLFTGSVTALATIHPTMDYVNFSSRNKCFDHSTKNEVFQPLNEAINIYFIAGTIIGGMIMMCAVFGFGYPFVMWGDYIKKSEIPFLY
eukprot:TRINITY_DN298_c0_g4_i1.p1 TRINITY_DN298_c0_g4~~TRINITY_DN298_c0_g4_i1.p1  ORF type:complete len:334 (+),score=67.01 TRINITY_DN298_c0_g4_i1:37-1038(+)